MALLLSTAYLPPLDYFAAMAHDASLAGDISPASVVLEACEHYRKQTWRNRCTILTASGKENLLIPVVHGRGECAGRDGNPSREDRNVSHIPVREVRIDYSVDWVHTHQAAISSAYGSSAYFEYYRDELFALLESKEPRLYTLNRMFIGWLLDRLHLPACVTDSRTFLPPASPDRFAGRQSVPARDGGIASMDEVRDLRERIHPKKAPCYVCRKPYYQIFSDRYGFVDGLSVLDLLFNEGPDSLAVLASTSRQE